MFKWSTRLTCLGLIVYATGGMLHADKKSGEAEVTLKILDWKGTQKLVQSQKGKVVVLDAWSTSCLPCMKEFPHLVELHRKYGPDKVACISLSCDYDGIKSKPPETYRERVLKFLRKQEATFTNILSSVPSDQLYEEIGIASIPAVFVYGTDGKLAKRFDNENATGEEDVFTYKDVNALVEELLAESR